MNTQMQGKSGLVYREIIEILKVMEEKYISKIPKELLIFFTNNASKEYKIEIDPKIDLREQNLQEDTITLLALLNLQYWCEDESKKKELITLYKKNEELYRAKENEQIRQANPFLKTDIEVKSKDDELKSKDNYIMVKEQENVSIVVPKKNFFEKLIFSIRKIFNKNIK